MTPPEKFQRFAEDGVTPLTEPEGSSGSTARNVIIGAGIAVTAVALAPIALPIIGLGAVAAGVVAVGAPLAAVVGGWMGWAMGGKTK